MTPKNRKLLKIIKQNKTLIFPPVFVLFILLGIWLGKNFATGNFRLLPVRVSSADVVSPAKFKQDLEKKNFTLINVHTPYEGEIEKTDSFIAYDEIVANKAKLPADKNAPIILYCRTGSMSTEALSTIKSLGYTNVKHLNGGMKAYEKEGGQILNLAELPDQVLPEKGFVLPITWGDLGPKLIAAGVIDLAKFEKTVKLTDEEKQILKKGGDIAVKIDSTNSQFVVDLLWAIGLAEKSIVYEQGPMGTEYKDKIGNFASTGGWSLAQGPAVNYLNKFSFLNLSATEQERVGQIVKNIYRPCCGNSTWFPDCNHGMAALAAVEMMVKKGLSDEEIYQNILKLNSFWFPNNYLVTATHFARQGIPWDKVDAKEALGIKYSSGQGAAEISKKVGPLPYGKSTAGSCGA